MKGRWKLWAVLICLLLLTGCGLRSGDDLYALPKTSVEYESLQQALQQLLDSGLEYAAPLSGSNTQPVQDVDLNGDGIGEAVAFFRDSSVQEASLKVYLFAQNEEGEYEVMTVIEGQGTAINSVTYSQFSQEENRQVVISWQISSGIYALSAYSVWQGGNQELLTSQSYTRYTIQDLNADGLDELILLHLNPADVSSNRAEWYSYGDGGLNKRGEVYLSNDLASIERIHFGQLYSGELALYVTGYATDGGESSNAIQITDILALRDGKLTNVTWNDSAASSLATRRRTYIADQDLDGDGIWEIPVLSNGYERLEDGQVARSENFFLVSWVQFDLEGNQHLLCTTYYNGSDGWYLTIPEEWKNRIALARSDYNEGVTSERSIQFYRLTAEGEDGELQLQTDPVTGDAVLVDTQAELFLTIYKNTGTDRATRSAQGDRQVLEMGDETAVYSVQIRDNPSHWTAQTVQENLHIITTNWSNE